MTARAAAGDEVEVLFLSPPAEWGLLASLPLNFYRRLLPTRWTTFEQPPRGSVTWWLDTLTYRWVRLTRFHQPARRKILRSVRRDPQARQAVETADVLVALDRVAVYPVWRLNRRRRRPAFYGGPAAVRYVEERLAATAGGVRGARAC